MNRPARIGSGSRLLRSRRDASHASLAVVTTGLAPDQQALMTAVGSDAVAVLPELQVLAEPAPAVYPPSELLPELAPERLLAPTVLREVPAAPGRRWPQRVGGLLIACACIVAATLYVSRVVSANENLLSGVVDDTGLMTLNFTRPGQLSRIDVRVGQVVRRGETLATEVAAQDGPTEAAARAAIASDTAKLALYRAAVARDTTSVAELAALANGGSAHPLTVEAQLQNARARLGPAQARVAAMLAQIQLDQAQLSQARAAIAATAITAPARATVVALNGVPGETVTPLGVRYYAGGGEALSRAVEPRFSLAPEGPQSIRPASAGAASLPLLALRASRSWDVVTLVSEGMAARLAPGRRVLVSVPGAGIADLRGKISEVLPRPIHTAAGNEYQVVVSIAGHAARVPLDGMSADIRLAP